MSCGAATENGPDKLLPPLPGLVTPIRFSHGSRRGLLSVAAPQLGKLWRQETEMRLMAAPGDGRTPSKAFAALVTLLLCLFTNPLPLRAANDVEEGRALAEELRGNVPAETARLQGTLKIQPRGKAAQMLPFYSAVSTGGKEWQVIYAITNLPAEEAVAIIHNPDTTNRYVRGDGKPMADVQTPFARSDFTLTDLGLEFLHWPQQRIVKKEMSRSRPCKVLESRPAPGVTNGYSRVLSWVDNESGGIIKAEAYDQRGKLLKEFALGSFKKVNGRWQLQDMKITNVQTGSRTTLEFEMPKE